MLQRVYTFKVAEEAGYYNGDDDRAVVYEGMAIVDEKAKGLADSRQDGGYGYDYGNADGKVVWMWVVRAQDAVVGRKKTMVMIRIRGTSAR